jgi:hypothetical protein
MLRKSQYVDEPERVVWLGCDHGALLDCRVGRRACWSVSGRFEKSHETATAFFNESLPTAWTMFKPSKLATHCEEEALCSPEDEEGRRLAPRRCEEHDVHAFGLELSTPFWIATVGRCHPRPC